MCQAGAGHPGKGKEASKFKLPPSHKLASRRPPCTARQVIDFLFWTKNRWPKKSIFIIFVLCPARDRGGHGLERRRGGARALGSCQPPAANPIWSGFTAAPPSLGPPVRRRPPRRKLAPWQGPAGRSVTAGHHAAPTGCGPLQSAPHAELRASFGDDPVTRQPPCFEDRPGVRVRGPRP